MKRFLTWLKMYLLGSGQRRKLLGVPYHVVTVFGIGVTVFEIWLGAFGTLDPYYFGTIFLTAMLAVTFMVHTPTKASTNLKSPGYLDVILSLLSLACGVYMVLNMDRYLPRVVGLESITTADMVFGTILFFLVLEGTRRTLGPGLTFVTITFVFYNLFGHHIPGYFSHRDLSFEFFIDEMVFTNDGLMGVPIMVAATYVFLFVFFGALLGKSGGGEFFFKLASALTGRTAGGPAKIAVVSSGLFGMISGSPTSDVVTTGSITIPMMRKMGYDRNFAGAVEAVASSGGSIMPPIMGSAAFLMVEYAGIPYLTIISAALIPAFLYYFSCFLQVHFYSKKVGLRGFTDAEIPYVGQVLREGYVYFLPLALLVFLLMKGYTASYAAVGVIFATIAISWINTQYRLGPRALYDAVGMVIPRIAPLAMACAAAGLVIGGIMATGLGGKFMSLIFMLSKGYLIPTMMVTMVVCIVLGMGMPVPSAYVLTAVLAAPALIKLGVPPLSAHLFIVYFAIASAITPPVAVAAYAAAAIAEGEPITIATKAIKLGIAAFLVPFLFVLEPVLLLQGASYLVVSSFVTGTLGIAMIAVALEGYFTSVLPWHERAIVGLGGLILLHPGLYSDGVGILLLVLALSMQRVRRRSRAGSVERA